MRYPNAAEKPGSCNASEKSFRGLRWMVLIWILAILFIALQGAIGQASASHLYSGQTYLVIINGQGQNQYQIYELEKMIGIAIQPGNYTVNYTTGEWRNNTSGNFGRYGQVIGNIYGFDIGGGNIGSGGSGDEDGTFSDYNNGVTCVEGACTSW